MRILVSDSKVIEARHHVFKILVKSNQVFLQEFILIKNIYNYCAHYYLN